ncbi:MAG TPA: hypothetical protein PK668_07850 [Myxococcota bacterium]|nr:hypothetical protein [Myxococcota bacterium]HRY93113.1 hypothetical protein [Myxococcota bacterium]HSA20355.1 hypothetical protein [Myxococcota bacterium]
MRSGLLLPVGSLAACLWGAGLGCGPAPEAELGVRLVRAEGALGPLANGFDRLRVARAVCQIALQDGTLVAAAEADLDVSTAPGGQALALRRVPPGGGYFARVLGLGLDGSVAECGASGPFSLVAGERRVVTIEIGAPAAADPVCERLCTADADCSAGQLCPSPCARLDPPGECLRALCAPFNVGAACAAEADCAGLRCLTPAESYPDGYCTARCAEDSGCPPGSHCKVLGGWCLKDCAGAADCRAGYACAQVSGAALGCLPE